MDKYNIKFLQFEIGNVLSGLSLLQKQSNKVQAKNISDLKRYITKEVKLINPYKTWK